MTVGDSISRVRNIIKSVNEDAFITDRLLYSLISKWGRFFLSQQKLQGVLGFVKSPNMYITLPCIKLIDVSSIEDCCIDLNLGYECTIKRTERKIPRISVINGMPLIRNVSSLDRSTKFYFTTSATYSAIQRSSYSKYNTRLYYFIQDDYLYFPNTEIEAVSIEASFENDVQALLCNNDNNCPDPLSINISIPDNLFSQIEEQTIRELTLMYNLPADVPGDDKQKANR